VRFHPNQKVRLTAAVVVFPRGARREYPAGTTFLVYDTWLPDTVRAADPRGLVADLPAAVLEPASPPPPPDPPGGCPQAVRRSARARLVPAVAA
jgi:hypothetical protein